VATLFRTMHGIIKSLFLLALAAPTVFATVIPMSSQPLLTRGSNLKSGDSVPRSLDRSALSPRNSARRTTTNAERFARGLPPSKPKRFWDSTRRQAGGPSVIPSGNVIQVTDANNGLLYGYISNTNNQGYIAATLDPAQYLEVTVSGDASDSTQDVLAVNGDSLISEYPYLGLLTTTGDTLSTSSENYGALVGATETAPHSGPVLNDGNTLAATEGIASVYSQTSIWSLSPSGDLTAVYVDPKGNSLPVTIVYLLAQNDFLFTADPSATISYINGLVGPGDAVEVTLTVVPFPV